MRRIKVDLSCNDWGKVIKKRVSAYEIDALWAAQRSKFGNRWTLTHRPSGLAAGYCYRTRDDARKAAKALTRKFGARAIARWTEHTRVRGARAIVSKYYARARRIAREEAA